MVKVVEIHSLSLHSTLFHSIPPCQRFDLLGTLSETRSGKRGYRDGVNGVKMVEMVKGGQHDQHEVQAEYYDYPSPRSTLSLLYQQIS